MKPRAVSMLGIVNWVSTRENLGVREHQGADQPVHQQSDQHFCYSLIGKYRTVPSYPKGAPYIYIYNAARIWVSF